MKFWKILKGRAQHVHEDFKCTNCTLDPDGLRSSCPTCGDELTLSAPLQELPELASQLRGKGCVDEIIITEEVGDSLTKLFVTSSGVEEFGQLTGAVSEQLELPRFALAN